MRNRSGATPPPEESHALRAAFEGVLQHEAKKALVAAESGRGLWRPLVVPGLLLVLLAGSAYVWFGRQYWIDPETHVDAGPPKSVNSGRHQLVAIALEIDDFNRSTGRLPERLDELGLDVPHISYVRFPDGHYELHLGTGPHSLYYRSGADAEPVIREVTTP